MASKKAKITKRIVDNLKPGELVWDTDIAGFAVRCQRQSKTYVLKVRISGRQRWFTIGRHGSPWTPDNARKEALTILAEVARGKDPASTRDAENKIPTIKTLVDRYLKEEVEPRRKEKTRDQYQDVLKRLAVPEIGKLKVNQVTYSDISALHYKLRGRVYQANRTLAVLSAMFSWAGKIGICERGFNPCIGIEKFKEAKHERFLSAEELGKLGNEITRLLELKKLNPYVAAAIRLLIFTGCRRNEILELKWAYVDMEQAVILLPDSKTGQKAVHLNAPAMAVLADIKKIAGNKFVICGQKEGANLVNLQKPWKKVCEFAGIEDVRINDMRHSFASVAASGGATLQVIGKLIGHKQASTTERYAHLASDPIKAANEVVGRKIDAMMKGESAEIVLLKKGT